jgi:hypothetical protein
LDCYTFNNTSKNVTLKGDRNIFLKEVNNVIIESGCTNNIFNTIVNNLTVTAGV